MHRTFRGGIATILLLALLSACTAPTEHGDGPATPSGTPEPATVTLTLANYGGLHVDTLLAEYQRSNPDIRIEITGDPVGASSYRPSLEDDIGGSSLADVVLFSDGSLPTVFANADRFANLADEASGADALPWASDWGTDSTGRVLAVPVTIEPAALCFRGDLLTEAGIAGGRDHLEQLLGADGGGWGTYFDVGRRYHEATGRAWFDQPEIIWRAMVSQVSDAFAYPAAGGAPVVDAELRVRWDLLAAAVTDGLSAHEEAWLWDGGRAFVDGSFATFLCPPWALDLVEANVTAGGGDASTGWDLADVLPGGGWSWAGAYAARTVTSAHPDEASDLVAWLIDPDQQAGLYAAGVGVPSDRQAAANVAEDPAPHAFFNDAPLGAIIASRAEHVPSGVVRADELQLAVDVFLPALHALDTGAADAPSAWADAMARLAEHEF